MFIQRLLSALWIINPTSKKRVRKMPEDNKGTTYSYDVCSECKIICCQDAKPPVSESRKKIIKKYYKNKKSKLRHPSQKKTILTHLWMKLFSVNLTVKKPRNVLFIQLSLKHAELDQLPSTLTLKPRRS